MIVETVEITEKGLTELVSTAILRFTPTAKDHGKFLSCRAVNEYFPGITKEDGFALDVKCKFHIFCTRQFRSTPK